VGLSLVSPAREKKTNTKRANFVIEWGRLGREMGLGPSIEWRKKRVLNSRSTSLSGEVPYFDGEDNTRRA